MPVYHHHHVTQLAWIFLSLSRHPSLSSIASGRYSGLHPVYIQSYCMWVRAGRPAFARPCEGVHKSTSLMSSSLLLQLYPICLFRLILIVFMMGGRCFVGCRPQGLFNIARSTLVWLSSSFFSIRLFSVHVVHSYCSIDTTAAWIKLSFILSVRFDFYMTDRLSLTAHAFARRELMYVSIDETVFPR